MANHDKHERYRRPPLDREKPIRNISTLFGAGSKRTEPEPATTSKPFARPAAPEKSSKQRRGVRVKAAAKERPDGISEEVRAGYRVIDDYLERGRSNAERTGAKSSSAQQASNTPNANRLTERMFQYAGDFAAVWMELMQTMVLGSAAISERQGAGAGPFGTVEPFDWRPAVRARPRRLTLEVLCARPVQTRCELFSDSHTGLVVQPLHAQDSALPPITGAKLAPDSEGGIAISIAIEPSQRAGAYSGLVVDRATHAPVGTLYVRILDSARAARAR